MEPQQSLQPQPDPPDDDPDQDPDRPPPHPLPVLLDSALSLVAQPLASAAARAAAAHPLALPLDDLNDCNVDLSWAGPDIDSLFLNETQYLQLGDDPPPSAPAPVPHTPSVSDTASKNPQQPTPLRIAPSASLSESPTATATVTQLMPDSQPEPSTSLSDPPIPSDLTTQNDPPPPPRSRPSNPIQKRSRARLNQPAVKQSPIPIAPHTCKKPRQTELKCKSPPPRPRSMHAQSSPLETVRPQSTPPVQNTDRSPASVSHDGRLIQNAPKSATHLPIAMGSHPVLPLMNMYPLQHHQFMFQSSPPVMSPAEPNTPDSKLLHPPSTVNPPDAKKMRLNDTQSPAAASQRGSQLHPGTQQPFFSPTMQMMPQDVVPYDASIMPFFQMAYAAAAAGYPRGIIPPIPAPSPNMPSAMLNSFGPNRAHGHHGNLQNVSASAADASTVNNGGQQPPAQGAKELGSPVVVQEGGTQVLVPQQKAARLERHPVLGRLQLKSAPKPQVASSSGLQDKFVSETQTSPVDEQQKDELESTRVAARTSNRAGSSSLGSQGGGQRQQKKRLVWTPELHDRFVKAINAVGLGQAVPKTLVTIMNVEGLTTEHVKSHLQKYRNSLRKEAAEEERDRSRGNAPLATLQNPKLGTPGASGASVIHSASINTPSGSAANQTGHPGSAAVTNTGGPQGVPILPSRISAFGGQLSNVIQPAPEARVSAMQTPKPISTPQAGQESSQRTAPYAQRSDGFHGNASGAGVVGQPSQTRNTTHERSDGDTMLTDGGAFVAENTKAVAEDSVADCVMQNSEHVATQQGGPDVGPGAGSPQVAQGERKLGPTNGVGTELGMSQKGGADTNRGHELSRDGPVGGDNEDGMVGSMPRMVVGKAASASQGTRDLELEVMKEETQQMQLQVQMMVYRTIALEKKLEEIHSERLNIEASGTADASKRSGVGTGNTSSVQNRDVETKDDTAKRDGGVVVDQLEQTGAEKCKGETEIAANRQRAYPSVDEKSVVKALLSEQIGLQKRLEDASAMIDKRMRRDEGGSAGKR